MMTRVTFENRTLYKLINAIFWKVHKKGKLQNWMVVYMWSCIKTNLTYLSQRTFKTKAWCAYSTIMQNINLLRKKTLQTNCTLWILIYQSNLLCAKTKYKRYQYTQKMKSQRNKHKNKHLSASIHYEPPVNKYQHKFLFSRC